MKSIAEISKMAKRYALGGAKVPHGMSAPVLRRSGDAFSICYFVFAYNKNEFELKRFPRPCEWLEVFADDGSLAARHECCDEDFSEQPGDRLYSLDRSSVPSPTVEELEAMDGLFDGVLRGIAAGEGFDSGAYGEYMSMLLSTTPPEYRIFYEELSRV